LLNASMVEAHAVESSPSRLLKNSGSDGF
jgi:hypothetical protein